MLVFLSVESHAQEESGGSIGTDRPLQSETPTVIPKKYIQLENGIYFEQGPDFTCENRVSNDLLAYNLLLKYGIIRNLELRLTFDYFNYTVQDRSTSEEINSNLGGAIGPYIGFKYLFLRQESGWKPDLTLSVHSQMKWWGREEFITQDPNVNFRLTAGKNITSNWFVIGGLGNSLVNDHFKDAGYFFVGQTGYSFFNRMSVAVEYYDILNPGLNQDQKGFDAGMVFLVNNNHQIDISAGKSLSKNFYGYYLSAGYSMRLRH